MDEFLDMLLLTSAYIFLLTILVSRSLPQFINLYANFWPRIFLFSFGYSCFSYKFVLEVKYSSFTRLFLGVNSLLLMRFLSVKLMFMNLAGGLYFLFFVIFGWNVHSLSGFYYIFLLFTYSSYFLNFSTCLIAYLYFCSPICYTFSIESLMLLVGGTIYSLGDEDFSLLLEREEKSRDFTWE